MKRLLPLLALAGCLAATAAGSSPPDLAQSYLLTPGGRLAHLRAGVTYGASQFPVALRVKPRDSSWWGVQWKSGDHYFQGGGPPHYGWVHIGHASSATAVPSGMVTIMTAYARTPSVAATVNILRTRGRGATYGATSPVELAGFSGLVFDGRIIGARNVDHIGHFFIPFSPPSHSAKYYPDEYPVYGDVFRVIVLDVRGKTVVVFVENVGLPADRFPAFLAKASRILESLRFPS